MAHNLIAFKGSKEGIYIYIKEGSFQQIKNELELKLEKSGSFFKGGKVINFKGKELTRDEKEELSGIIKYKYDIAVETNDVVHLNGDKISETFKKGYFLGIHEGKTKFVKITVRSGQTIEYGGNIVIFGDVNPGAVVSAKGNIIVMGTLRGIAHAGNDGNREAIVAAINLQPTQLRIADIISRPPDDEAMPSGRPEIARIINDDVVIEAYLQKNNY